ncbi:MAG TPA: methyltransferase domain-containing protein [Casimicrobiaceae bacterium]|nr:methyltransferase domain-containing protein [Casimicrobiaceae bacterium]
MSGRPADLTFRQLEPEILDGLAEDDPRAIASRRDLARLNVLMFQPSIMARLLRSHMVREPRRILEIGAGDGSFMLTVARRLARRWPAVELVLLDRRDLVTALHRAEFRKIGWQTTTVTTDVFEWTAKAGDERFDAITVNLFLHHFEDAALGCLLAGLAPLAPVFVATEPRRATFPLAASRMLWAIGVNDVTTNDAPASVRAGFTGMELTKLWPEVQGTWTQERRSGLFTHAFAAVAASDQKLS